MPPLPVPGGCQSFQADVPALEAEAQQLRADALAAAGPAAWAKLSELGLTLLQLERARADLQACIDAHSGTVVCDLDLIDAGGGGTADARQAALWDLSGDPVLLETVPVFRVGTVVVELQTIAAALAPPTVRLTGVGTLTASFTAVGEVASPLTATVTLGLVPSTAPDPLVPAELTLAAPPHVELAGPAAAFGAVLNTAVLGYVAGRSQSSSTTISTTSTETSSRASSSSMRGAPRPKLFFPGACTSGRIGVTTTPRRFE